MAVLLLVTSSACGDSGAGRGADVPRQARPAAESVDSAGIRVTSTPASLAMAPLGWTVDSIPDLVLGDGSGDGQSFFRVGGVTAFRDGAVAVVDGGDREIRVFDAAGRFVRAVGRRGEGPGEFEDPVLVPSPGSDSLTMWDVGLARFQKVSVRDPGARGMGLRTRWPAGRRAPVGALGSKMLVARRVWDISDPPFREGVGRRASVVSWVDVETGTETPLDSFVVARHFTTVARGRPPSTLSIPFTVMPSAAVRRGGALVTGGGSYEIRAYDVEGRLSGIARVTDMAQRPVTDDVVDAEVWRLAESGGDPGRLRDAFAAMPIPDVLPAFRSLRVDEMGWTWAEIYHAGTVERPSWMLFDSEGRARGVVHTPAGLELHWIGEDALLGVWRDELGAEQVRRYALRRVPEVR